MYGEQHTELLDALSGAANSISGGEASQRG